MLICLLFIFQLDTAVSVSVYSVLLTTPEYSFSPQASIEISASDLQYDFSTPVESFQVSGWFRLLEDPTSQVLILSMRSSDTNPISSLKLEVTSDLHLKAEFGIETVSLLLTQLVYGARVNNNWNYYSASYDTAESKARLCVAIWKVLEIRCSDVGLVNYSLITRETVTVINGDISENMINVRSS